VATVLLCFVFMKQGGEISILILLHFPTYSLEDIYVKIFLRQTLANLTIYVFCGMNT
jgi:hypothetical protein